MTNKARIAIILMLMAVATFGMALIASADGHKDDHLRPDLPTITEMVVASDDFDTLETAVVAAGLADTLAGAGPYTVFAPTDDAFAALDSATLNAALADPNGLLTEVLLYHVVAGDVGSDTVLTLDSVATLQGQPIHIKFFEGDVYLNDEIKITMTDIIASNGRVHVIDAVLLPPSEAAAADNGADADLPAAGEGFTRPELPTITDMVVDNGDFETLETAVVAAGLADTLDQPGSYTVFAPTDEAFAALDSATLNAALADPAGLLTDVLLYHVVSGDVGSEIVLTLDSATTLQGEEVRIKFFDGTVYLNDEVAVTTTDVVAANGVIHIIDAVLLPPSIAPAPEVGTGGGGADMVAGEFTRPELPTITDIAVGDERFDTLVGALTATNLAGVLDQPGPYTVFAPTDDAFAKLPAGTLDSLTTQQLADILLYHVVSGDVGSEIVLTLDSATTVNGAPVQIKFFDGNVYLNEEIKVTITDIVAANGVVHVIDTVLLPPAE